MEIISNVHRVPGVDGANVYLLLDETLTLVDTGMPRSAETILEYTRSLGRAPTDLTRILLTHHHIDHVGGLAELKRQTGATVLAHPDDAPFIAGEQPPPLPHGIVMRLIFCVMSLVFRAEPVPVDVLIEEGQTLDVLGGATVVHAPGHTSGSIALHVPAEGLLISGDAINRRDNRLGLPPKPFTQDMERAIASIRRLVDLDFDVLCPGHGDPIVGGAAEQVRAMLREQEGKAV
jgi:glyoxylase-like metal-dependent hydrolase (beta-lactamase superfamily II)